MTVQTRNEYIKIVRRKYARVKSRSRKRKIIREVIENTGLHEKSVIRALNRRELRNRKSGSGRKEEYTYDLIKPIEGIWEVSGRACSKNLTPQVPELLKKLEEYNEIKVTDRQRNLLNQISSYGVEKLLKSKKKKLGIRGLSGTKSSSHLKSLIPIRTQFDLDTKPGDLEVDCVLHCGDNVSGIFAETLNMLDVATHWNERRIVLAKTKGKIVGSFHLARQGFPFPVKSIDFDNGFEFVNWSMYEYCKRHKISFTRCRSYHKNDQAHIEGKNYHSVRKIIGYERIENEEIVNLVADIYSNELRLLTNYFYTTRKLVEKKKVGGKVTKRYDEAKTPYKRVLISKDVDIKVKMKLMQEYKKLNPAELYRSLQGKLGKLPRMVR